MVNKIYFSDFNFIDDIKDCNIMTIIKESIKKCFTYYNEYVKEYERFYTRPASKTKEQFTEDDIRKAASVFSYIEFLSEYIYLYQKNMTCIVYDQNLIIGYEVYVSESEYNFTLVVDNGENSFKAPLNYIANECFGEVKFTRGIIISNRSELKEVFKCVCILGNIIRQYILDMSCCPYYNFLTKSNFLSDYENFNILHSDKNINFGVDKKTVFSLLEQYDGFSVKYYSSDRFYRITRTTGDVEIGYNVEIKKSLINFIIWGKIDGESIFAEPSVNILVRNHGSGKKLHRLQFNSIVELKEIFDFMLNYLDDLASYFHNDTC